MENSTQILSAEVVETINEIISEINSGEVVIFCGAGISRDSGLPVVNQLVPYMLEKLEVSPEDLRFILDENNNSRIPFEAFMQGLQEGSKLDKIFDIYDQGEPNTNHLLLAKLIKAGKIKTIVTTNFDKLIEKALLMEPKPFRENDDYDVVYKERDLENINWSDKRIRIIKVHGSVHDKDSMAITLRLVASQELSKPRMTVIQQIFSSGNNTHVLVLGYSSSDVFDISPQILATSENHKKVFYVQHSYNFKVEEIEKQPDKNPFKKFKGSQRIYLDTNLLVVNVWESIIGKPEPYKAKNSGTGWKEYVDAWEAEAVEKNGEIFRHSIPGNILMRMGEAKKAIKYYDKALQISKECNDKYKEVLWLGNLGGIYAQIGRYDMALENYEQALQIAKDINDKHTEGTGIGNIGNIYRVQGKYRKAIENFEQALAIAQEVGDKRGEAIWFSSIGNACQSLGEYGKAIENYKQALQIAQLIGDKQNEGNFFGDIGSIYADLGKPAKAIENFKQALEIAQEIGDKQKKGHWLGSLGGVYGNLGESGKAITILEQALAIAQEIDDKYNEGAWLGNLGLLHYRLGDYQKAIGNYEQSLAIARQIGDKQVEGVRLGDIGTAYGNSGEYDKAIKNYELALKIAQEIEDKRSEGMWLGHLGKAYGVLNELPKAITYFEQALVIAEKTNDRRAQGQWLGDLGTAYWNLGYDEKAIKNYTEALKIARETGDKQNEGQWLGNLGLAYSGLNQHKKAIEYYKHALDVFKPMLGNDHSHIKWLENSIQEAQQAYSPMLDEVESLNIGIRLFLNQQFAEAEYFFQQIINVFPNHPDLARIYNFLGSCILMQSRYEEATSWFQKAIDQNPDADEPYCGMGECLRLGHKYEEAASWFQKAIELNPQNAYPYHLVGECLSMQFKHEEAKTWFQGAIDRKPELADAYYRMGNCFGMQHRYEEAKPWFQKAIEKNSESAGPYNGMAQCLNHQKKYTEAMDWYQKAIDRKPEWEVPYDGIGKCLVAQYRCEEAKSWYQKAIEMAPEWEEPYDNMGECLRLQGEYKKAKSYFYTAIIKNRKYSMPYFRLSLLPVSAFDENEMYGQPWFNRFLILLQPYDRIDSVYLKKCISFDSPMLFFQLFAKADDYFPDMLYAFPELMEDVSITEPFRKQFALWASGRKSEQSSWTVEALLNFYCGNPVRAYEIFDNELDDTSEDPLSLLHQYYFALSALNIIEDHKGCINAFALPQARKTLERSSSFTDQYYAALILDLAGYTDEAISVLSALNENGFVPARYKCAELKRKEYANDIDYEQNIIGDLSIQMNLEVNYFRYPEKIILNEDEDKMLQDLMPLIHFMENRQVLECVYAYQRSHQVEFNENPFDKKSFFASNIIFSHLEEDKALEYVQKVHANTFEKVFGSNDERELLQPEIKFYKDLKNLNKSPCFKLGTDIHVNSYALYNYLKNDLKDPPQKFNYRHHLLLVANLKKKKLVTNDEACLLHEYIKYCAEKVYSVSPENEFLEIPLSEIKEHISKALDCGVGYHTVEAALKYAFHKVKEKQSELISFKEFTEIVARRNQGE